MASKTQDGYDVLVVGSGASGGWAAKRLAEAGVKVALARRRDGRIRHRLHRARLAVRPALPRLAPSDDPKRRARRRRTATPARSATTTGSPTTSRSPTRPPRASPSAGRAACASSGGRTNVWGRQSYRFSDLDFKAASHDGFGEDWPLAYADLAPYYDLVEDYVGISGMAEGVHELPDSRSTRRWPSPARSAAARAGEERSSAGPSRSAASANITSRSTAARRATTAGRASAAASRTPTSTRRSPPWPTRSRPATARSSRTRWSTRC